MVRIIKDSKNAEKRVLLDDDTHAPINNINIGHFWYLYPDSTLERLEQLKALQHYTGPEEPTTESPKDFNPDRPFKHDLSRMHQKTGGLKLDRKIPWYKICMAGDAEYHPGFVRHRIISRALQTGDVCHIACAMIWDPLLDVIIFTEPGKSASKIKGTYFNAIRDQARDEKEYERLNEPTERVVEYPTATDFLYRALRPQGKSLLNSPLRNTEAWTKDKRNQEIQDEIENHRKLWGYVNGLGGILEYVSMGVTGCTTLIALAYQKHGPEVFFSTNTTALSHPQITEDEICDWAGEQGLNLKADAERRDFCIIWSRYSGSSPNGYNPAGDSSVEGQKQLIDWVKNLGFEIITIGHDYNENTKTPRGNIHLGEFWAAETTPLGKPNPFFDKDRAGQTSFYALLHKRHNIFQLGQKTGGVDNAALLGVRTIYIEDKGSPYQSRMLKWSQVMEHYKGVIIDLPPTAIGKALRKVEAGLPEDTRYRDPKKNLDDAKKKLQVTFMNNKYSTEAGSAIVTQVKNLMNLKI
ncbi:hypothetical protein GYMLUDRAFT_942678 [Collybiopsis luxurians FD-317 M1]|uniref:Uncharacterized protein n=1 Tax=Collybiopsis luxurians FD-317 M1 TaxID=944289 RepID=A0A0D0ARZ9_9AGAR|nr:hypothetical protein GYMLUDRAFT_942678 [Collybiopsis luxurians FD-317 M1]